MSEEGPCAISFLSCISLGCCKKYIYFLCTCTLLGVKIHLLKKPVCAFFAYCLSFFWVQLHSLNNPSYSEEYALNYSCLD